MNIIIQVQRQGFGSAFFITTSNLNKTQSQQYAIKVNFTQSTGVESKALIDHAVGFLQNKLEVELWITMSKKSILDEEMNEQKFIDFGLFHSIYGFKGASAEVKKGSMEDIGRPSPETGPTKVQTVIGFLDIDSINTATQIFEANVFIGLTWKDLRLAHSGSGPVKYPLDKIWNPTLQIANEVGMVRKTFPEVAIVHPDGTVSCKQRYVGTFSQALNLKDFPFDQHKFVLQLIAPGYTPEDIQFVPDKQWIDRGVPYAALISKDLSLPDWEISEIKTEETPYFVVEGFGLAGYTFEFKGKRHVEYYLLKVIMPLILIVMMSWACFWIDPENSGTQIGVASTSMLTLIAYRFAIDSYVPKVSYTTRLDEFIFMSTVVVFIALVQTVATSMLFQYNKVSLSKKIDIVSRIFFPILFFSSTFLILLR